MTDDEVIDLIARRLRRDRSKVKAVWDELHLAVPLRTYRREYIRNRAVKARAREREGIPPAGIVHWYDDLKEVVTDKYYDELLESYRVTPKQLDNLLDAANSVYRGRRERRLLQGARNFIASYLANALGNSPTAMLEEMTQQEDQANSVAVLETILRRGRQIDGKIRLGKAKRGTEGAGEEPSEGTEGGVD